MKIFSKIYEYCIRLTNHRLATSFMCLNSFCESIFWPIPADVMLLPMCVSKRNRAFYYAPLTVVTSVLGAIVGYYLGYYLYDPYVARAIAFFHYEHHMEVVRSWLTGEFGILMVFIGAFTPVPYKVIAVTTGLVACESVLASGTSGSLSVLIFVLVSLVGRGLRFYLEALVIYLGGEKMEKAISKYIDRIGWAIVIVFVIFVVYKIIA